MPDHLVWTDTWWRPIARHSKRHATVRLPDDIARPALDRIGEKGFIKASYWHGPTGSTSEIHPGLPWVEQPHFSRITVRAGKGAELSLPLPPGGPLELLVRVDAAEEPTPRGAVVQTLIFTQGQRRPCPLRFFEADGRWFARWRFTMARWPGPDEPYVGTGGIDAATGQISWAEWYALDDSFARWLDGAPPPRSAARVGTTGPGVVVLEDGRPRFHGGPWGPDPNLPWTPVPDGLPEAEQARIHRTWDTVEGWWNAEIAIGTVYAMLIDPQRTPEDRAALRRRLARMLDALTPAPTPTATP